MNAILWGRNTLPKNILFILSSGWPKIASSNLLCTVPFAPKYSSNLVFIHFLRWTVSPSSSRVTEFCTGRHQACLHQVPGKPKMWRSLLSAASSSPRSKRASCMRSRSALISTSSKAWTVNPERHGRLRKVCWRRTCWVFVNYASESNYGASTQMWADGWHMT